MPKLRKGDWKEPKLAKVLTALMRAELNIKSSLELINRNQITDAYIMLANTHYMLVSTRKSLARRDIDE